MKKARVDAVRFTDDEREAIGKAAAEVWQAVGGEVLTCVADSDGLKPYEATMSRREVIEICLDAERMEDQLRVRRATDKRRGRESVVTDDLLKRVGECGYAQLISIVMPHFPFQRYGF